VTRKDPDGKIEAVLNEDERVDLPTMLAAYTINGARLAHEEQTRRVDRKARPDLIVLDKSADAGARADPDGESPAYVDRQSNRVSSVANVP
jgi:predicted amidohydrolase YtcJ